MEGTSQKAQFNNKWSRSIVEETQLLAEEKWLIEALTKIKNQRNCLQIERFHLESLKVQMKNEERKESQTVDGSSSTPTMSSVEMIPQVNASQELNFDLISVPHTNIMDEEAFCNEEELNLTVTDSIFGKKPDGGSFNMEEEEEEDENEDILIDMNMFMNGMTE